MRYLFVLLILLGCGSGMGTAIIDPRTNTFTIQDEEDNTCQDNRCPLPSPTPSVSPSTSPTNRPIAFPTYNVKCWKIVYRKKFIKCFLVR